MSDNSFDTFCVMNLVNCFIKLVIYQVSFSTHSFQSMLVYGFMRTNLSSIQKRFRLSSTESICIILLHDIASVVFTIPIAYSCGRTRRLRVCSVGMLLVSCGSVIMTMPHFLSDEYVLKPSIQPACYRQQNVSINDVCSRESRKPGALGFKFLFWLGSFIVGVGSSPLTVLCITYMSDNTSRKLFPLFLGKSPRMGRDLPAFTENFCLCRD